MVLLPSGLPGEVDVRHFRRDDRQVFLEARVEDVGKHVAVQDGVDVHRNAVEVLHLSLVNPERKAVGRDEWCSRPR